MPQRSSRAVLFPPFLGLHFLDLLPALFVLVELLVGISLSCTGEMLYCTFHSLLEIPFLVGGILDSYTSPGSFGSFLRSFVV